jgi:hypothetical protein
MDQKKELKFDQLFATRSTYTFCVPNRHDKYLNYDHKMYIKYWMENGALFCEYRNAAGISTMPTKISDFSIEDCKYIREYYLSLQN